MTMHSTASTASSSESSVHSDPRFDAVDETASERSLIDRGARAFHAAGSILSKTIALASLEGRQAMHYATRMLMCALVSALLVVFIILSALVGIGYYLYHLGLQPETAAVLMGTSLIVATFGFAWGMKWYSNRPFFTETRRHLEIHSGQLKEAR